MAYASLSDLEKLVPRAKILDLAYDAELGGVKDIADSTVVAIINQALSDAESEVDTYLNMVTVTPLTGTIPNRIIEVTAHLTIWRLYERRSYAMGENSWQNNYDAQIDWLKMLARGRVRLDFDAGAGTNVKIPSRVRTNVDAENDPKEFDETMM